MYCICCKKNKITPGSYLENMSEEDFIWKVEKRELETQEEREHFGAKFQITNANNRMWDDGIVHIIDAGYGSKHDTDKFVIAICDECIKENLEDGTLLYHGNYMSPDSPFVEEEKDKSKQIYRRRKNLDNLI
jgi:hypothetical protein